MAPENSGTVLNEKPVIGCCGYRSLKVFKGYMPHCASDVQNHHPFLDKWFEDFYWIMKKFPKGVDKKVSHPDWTYVLFGHYESSYAWKLAANAPLIQTYHILRYSRRKIGAKQDYYV